MTGVAANLHEADAPGGLSPGVPAPGTAGDSTPRPAQPGTRATPGARLRRAVLLAGRVVFTTAVVAAVGFTAVRQWAEVRSSFHALSWASVLFSGALVLAGLAAQTMAMRAALGQLGHHASLSTTGQIYLIGQLGKYVPGSVWTFVLQMEIGRRARIPRSRVFLAALVTVALSTAAALLLGVAGLRVLFQIDRVVTVLVLVLVPAVLVCAHPRVLTWLLQRFLALLHRPGLDRPIGWAGVATIMLWTGLAWVFLGVHVWLLAGTRAGGLGLLASCVAAIALGITAGLVAFLSPSGLGVREAMVVAVLLPYMSAGAALGVALASRLVFTAAELVAAGAAALAGLRGVRTAGQGTPGPEPAGQGAVEPVGS